MNSHRLIAPVRWTLAFGALAGIVLVYYRWLHVSPTTVALSLLLLVLLLAAGWGMRYAVVLSIAATIAYNYFFLPPIRTFTIADPQNWLALFAFLATAIIASRLSDQARDEALDARARQRELEVLFRLSRELLHSDSVTALLSAAPSAVASVTGASSALLYLLDGERLYQAGDSAVTEVELPHLHQLALTITAATADGEEMQIPLRSGVRPTGLVVLRGATLSRETADAIGGLISVSIDRGQALESLARGEVAKESERLRTLMIDSITHELRTPLTSIKGAATTLLSGKVQGSDSVELLTIIDEECDRLDRLVAEAVEMAQLDAQQVQMHFGMVPVRELVDEALQTSSWVEEQHGVEIHVPKELEVWADRAFAEKVIANLLENAGKYSPKGTPIVVTAEKHESEVSISVADRGIGIDASEQTLIFERFYRVDSHNTRTSGTGMGLPISRAIVEAHGGTIKVTSQPGQGSVFTFTLRTSAF
jgi:two-component system sensor histidine kinase KdpD